MVDFSVLLSESARARMTKRDREIRRLYALDRRWLAEAIYDLGRRARMETGYRIADRHYGSALLWLVIPELSFRLGRRTERLPDEYDREIRTMSGVALREYVHYGIANTPDRSDAERAEPSALTMILHSPANGNPLVFAMDRICPGNVAHPDAMTQSLMRIAHTRGTRYDGIWTPDILVRRPADIKATNNWEMEMGSGPQ